MLFFEVFKINGNEGWIFNQYIFYMFEFKEIFGVMWSLYCFVCDFFKIFENEIMLGDEEMGDYEEFSGNGLSGEGEISEMKCYVIFEEFYYYFKVVNYGVFV